MAVASDLEKGKYFLFKGEIHKVLRKEVVAYGTHSHTKIKLYIQDLEGKGEKVINLAHTDRVDMVDIVKKTAQVISKNTDNVQIMDAVSYETFDAEVDDDLKKLLSEGDHVIFINYNNLVKVLEKK
jgi:translation elongation factor P/translation initiation factor 5A